MADIKKALETQLANIQKRTGKSLAELARIVQNSGLTKHGELVKFLKAELGMGHGDANAVVHTVLRPVSRGDADAPEAGSADDSLTAIYAGPKQVLRPIHDRLMTLIRDFGDFEESPKKTYISLRRKKQFAMIGPATNSKIEVGLNAKDLTGSERLTTLPKGQMCGYKIRLGSPEEIDAELLGWLRQAYDSAG